MTLNDRGIGVEIYHEPRQLITLSVNQSISIGGGVSDETKPLTHARRVREFGVNQFALTFNLPKREEANGDTSGPPMSTPQQRSIFGANINETSTLQSATTIRNRAGEDPWMTALDS
jgi:hypothetical protein